MTNDEDEDEYDPEDDKTFGEKIVDRLCEGKTLKQIQEDLGITQHTVKERLFRIRIEARLPWENRVYPYLKDDIQANIEKWKAYRKRLTEIRDEYLATLVKFDRRLP